MLPNSSAALDASYLHSLASTYGVLPLGGVSLNYDTGHRELVVTGGGLVRVFNDSGMEVFTFGEDPGIGGVLSAVPIDDGGLMVLSSLEGKLSLLRCNFRGEPVGRVELKDVPEAFSNLSPTALRYVNGKLYLADSAQMKVLVADGEGKVVAAHDVAKLLGLEAQRADTGFRGFNVDGSGNLLVTVQPLFSAYVISPAGEVKAFGIRGSGPGKFNVVGGIARDPAGNIYVADILRSAVIVFDPSLKFVREFGYRGRAASNLAAPDELALGDGKLYVANNGRRGVSVFKVGQQ